MSDTVVLVSSTDSFRDCWDASLACLKKYWGDCPYQIFTSSNLLPWGENPITAGPDRGWVNNLKAALDRLDAEFVCLFLEDMLLCEPVKTNQVQVAEALMFNAPEIGAIRLGQGNEKCNGGFVNAFLDQYFRPVANDSDYRISTSPTLWRVSYLRTILDNCGLTAWDFELAGTEFSRNLPGLIVVPRGKDDTTRPIKCYYTGILKGKWVGECLEWLKTIGIEVADTSRGVVWLKDQK